MARHGKQVLIALGRLGFRVAHGFVAVLTNPSDLQVKRLAPGIFARPMAEQGSRRGFTGWQRVLEGHQATAEQQNDKAISATCQAFIAYSIKCGRWLACDTGASVHPVIQGDAIAGKPAPT